MYASACSSARRAAGIGLVVGGGDARGDRDAHPRVRAVGDHRLEGVGVDRDRLVERRRRRRSAACASGRPRRPSRRPAGACGRPWTYSKVVSSGAISPARAPPSMLMLQIVMRCSIVSARIASPRYSKTWPVPPPTPIRAIRARMMSLAADAGREPAVDPDLVGLRVALEQASASRGPSRPRSSRSRTPAPRTRRGSTCASRRTRSSSPAASARAAGR